jgi:hypothetical protein
VEGAPINRASRSIPNYLIRLLPPLTIHNRLPYAVEVKVPTIKYEVRIEAGEKTNIYFLNLLKMHKICVEVFIATHISDARLEVFMVMKIDVVGYHSFGKPFTSP